MLYCSLVDIGMGGKMTRTPPIPPGSVDINY